MDQNEAKIELDAVLNTLVDGVAIIDERGIMRLFNPACERIFGWTSDEMVGKNVKVLMPEPYQSEHDGYIENYHTTHERKIIGIGREVSGRRKDGTVFSMDLAVGETTLDDRPIYVGIIRDLTERHQQRDKYETLQQEHFHLSRVSAMNEMGAAIAHELNQPMTATINYLEAGKLMLAHGQMEEKDKFQNVLNSAIDQTKRASDIIARLRKFIETGDVEKESANLKMCLGVAIEMALLPFKHNAIELNFDVTDDLPAVLVNQVQLQQVVVNLVKNACESMQDTKTRQLSISAELVHDGHFVEVCISDTGKGIKKSEHDDLFKPFSTEKVGGMGVGLSISNSIITNHGGKIWAERNEPHGAKFYFTLPVSEEPL